MRYEDSAADSSWEKMNRKINKTSRKPKSNTVAEIDKSHVPTSYIGNEELWEDISEELEEMYG